MLDMARVGGCLGWSIPLPQGETIVEQLPYLLVTRPVQIKVRSGRCT